MGEKSLNMGFRCPPELARKMRSKMAELGMKNDSDFIRCALEEKIKYMEWTVEEEKANYDPGNNFDVKLKRALVTNPDIQKIICDLVEKSLKENKK